MACAGEMRREEERDKGKRRGRERRGTETLMMQSMRGIYLGKISPSLTRLAWGGRVVGGPNSQMFAMCLLCCLLTTVFTLDSFTRREGHRVTATTGASLVGVMVVVATGRRTEQ